MWVFERSKSNEIDLIPRAIAEHCDGDHRISFLPRSDLFNPIKTSVPGPKSTKALERVAELQFAVPRACVHTIEADGVRVFYRAAGNSEAPVVLLLHGFPTSCSANLFLVSLITIA